MNPKFPSKLKFKKEYQHKTVVKLKQLLDDEGLSKQGKKTDLIDRLFIHLKEKNKINYINLRNQLDALGLSFNGIKDALHARLKEYGTIPLGPTKLDHLDTYQDWETGGGWIKGVIYRYVQNVVPEYDYETDTDGCTCDYICRCRRLINIEVNLDDSRWSYQLVKNALEDVMTTDAISDIGKYYIFRTLSLLLRDACRDYAYDNLFEAYGAGGYYGEELQVDCFIKPCLYAKLADGINLPELLHREYGNNLQDISLLEIKEIDPKIIEIPNQVHYQKCMDEDIYDWYHGIIAICSFNNNKYKLKDGYHRLASAIKRGDISVKIIVALFE